VSDERTLRVPGMTCEHCRAAIAAELSAVEGVSTIEVDLDEKLVRVRGHALDDERLRAAIDEAGYEAA
jgi:copper chaperone